MGRCASQHSPKRRNFKGMNTRLLPAIFSIGAALQACTREPPPLLVNFSPAPTEDGRPGYTLFLPKETWAFVRWHKGISEAELNTRVHAQVQYMIEAGMRENHGACSRSWLISDVARTPDGGMVFSLFCATPAEIKAQAAKDGGFKVTT